MPMLAALFLAAVVVAAVFAYRHWHRYTLKTGSPGLGPIEPLRGAEHEPAARHRPFKPIYHITMGALLPRGR